MPGPRAPTRRPARLKGRLWPWRPPTNGGPGCVGCGHGGPRPPGIRCRRPPALGPDVAVGRRVGCVGGSVDVIREPEGAPPGLRGARERWGPGVHSNEPKCIISATGECIILTGRRGARLILVMSVEIIHFCTSYKNVLFFRPNVLFFRTGSAEGHIRLARREIIQNCQFAFKNNTKLSIR